MTFAEIVAQIVLDTNRPDLGLVADGGDGQIANFVFSTTLNLHTLDFFWRDIQSVDVVFDAAAYIQTLDVQAIPRFRALAIFRKWDPTFNSSQQNPNILPPLYNGLTTFNGSQALAPLTIITPDDILDSYGTERVDVAYAAGATICIKSSTPLSQGKLDYYAYPELDVSGGGLRYTSWIADNHPWAIIYSAEARIYAITGDMDKARELVRPANPRNGDPGGLVPQELASLRMNNIEAVGR